MVYRQSSFAKAIIIFENMKRKERREKIAINSTYGLIFTSDIRAINPFLQVLYIIFPFRSLVALPNKFSA